MSLFERVLGESVFLDAWKQVRQYLFSEGRFMQLISLKPIDIFEEEIEIEIDGAKINLFIKSDMDNIMRRGIERTIHFLQFNPAIELDDYGFDISIQAQMPFKEVNTFFNTNFANIVYPIFENKADIVIQRFEFGNDGTNATARIFFTLHIHWLFIKKTIPLEAVLKAAILFNDPKYVIRTNNLHYELITNNQLLKGLDHWYFHEINVFLTTLLTYNFEEELNHVKQQAQAQIDSFQSQTNWIKGTIKHVELDRLDIGDSGVNALFLADGKIHIVQ